MVSPGVILLTGRQEESSLSVIDAVSIVLMLHTHTAGLRVCVCVCVCVWSRKSADESLNPAGGSLAISSDRGVLFLTSKDAEKLQCKCQAASRHHSSFIAQSISVETLSFSVNDVIVITYYKLCFICINICFFGWYLWPCSSSVRLSVCIRLKYITAVRVADAVEVKRLATWILHLHTSYSTCHEAAVPDVSPPIRLHQHTSLQTHHTWLHHTWMTETLDRDVPDWIHHRSAPSNRHQAVTPGPPSWPDASHHSHGVVKSADGGPAERRFTNKDESARRDLQRGQQSFSLKVNETEETVLDFRSISSHTFLSETTVNAVWHTGTLSPQLPGDWRDEDCDHYWPAVPDVTSSPAAALYHAL